MNHTFDPILLRTFVEEPLRYFFANYAGEDYKYVEDSFDSRVDITTVNNFNQENDQNKPRILVNRGSFQARPNSLSDNMFRKRPTSETMGLDESDHMIFLEGTVSIIIEARDEGVCETLTDMVYHFFAWSAPFICDSLGFKSFGLPIQVSECRPQEEDTSIFQVQISLPWVREEAWSVRNDALRLRDYYLDLSHRVTPGSRS